MNRLLTLLTAGIAGAIIALLALSFAGSAMAQGPGVRPAQPTPGAMPYSQGRAAGRGRMAGPSQAGGRGQSLVGMAAAELGLTQEQLVAQLGADGTIADALSAGAKDPAAFIDSFVATRAARLDAAVAAGRMTREAADAQLATARSMATARIYQPFTARGPGQMGGQAGTGARRGGGFIDANGDGICDLMPTANAGQ